MTLPDHLQKYIVTQNYEKYTPVDQACWRYILRQLKSFLGKNAHECYLEGLEKTGIEIERIPKISEIDEKLCEFGWRAMAVSGFIPPAAFMELQSLGVLPIACDMRTLDHLEYTPAPDIVHEAAGHAPILIQPEFSKYLQEYAQVAKKAIISKEDLNIYDAIRDLSDVKENPNSTSIEIENAQRTLDQATSQVSHVSEAAELGRMNWWTAEYGLIGDIESPKIFGAGLLSSVGESRLCLSSKVKKIPLSLDCIQVGYDITEPQPQLFVSPDFKTLSKVLQEMASKMAFSVGGLAGIKKAIQSETVNTAKLNSGIQISGICTEVIERAGQAAYLKFAGPTQLSYQDHELLGHDKTYHRDGFGTPVGNFNSSSPLRMEQKTEIIFESGVKVRGILKSELVKQTKPILLSFSDCTVSIDDKILFEPSWGIFDMAVGQAVTSVYSGPADRLKFGTGEDFIAKRVPSNPPSDEQKLLHLQYQSVRSLRETKVSGASLEQSLEKILKVQKQKFPNDWLLHLEAYELLQEQIPSGSLTATVRAELESLKIKMPEKATAIQDGLNLIKNKI